MFGEIFGVPMVVRLSLKETRKADIARLSITQEENRGTTNVLGC